MARAITRKLQCTGKDQYILTIPKTLVALLDWKAQDSIFFGFDKGKLTLTTSPTPIQRTLQVTPKGQYTLTIPKTLISLLNWKAQDTLFFGFEQGNISLSKGGEPDA